MELKHWTPAELVRKLARRTGYYKWQYKKRYPDVPSAIFFWIPKNGGTSMYNALKDKGMMYLSNRDAVRFYFPQQGLATFTIMNYSDLLTEKIVSKDYHTSAFKFAIARNPYARAVSAYFYFIGKGWINENAMSFNDFASHLARLDFNIHRLGVWGSRDHLFPQCDYISHQGEIITDYVAHLETIEQDVKHIQECINLQFDYPHLNKSKHLSYREYYNESSRKNIYQVYEQDFDMFGYPSKLI